MQTRTVTFNSRQININKKYIFCVNYSTLKKQFNVTTEHRNTTI